MVTFGKTVRRVEDEGLVTGRARFVADLDIPGVLTMVVLRSPFAHCTVSVDVAPARSAPGVVGAWTGADLSDLVWPQVGVKLPLRPALAGGRARYVGEGVAVVVATTPAAARDALELIDADFDPLPAAVTIAEALAPDAPLVEESIDSNIAWSSGTFGDDDPITGAPIVIRRRYLNQRMAPGMLEGRAVVAVPTGDGLVLHAGHQIPHSLRDRVAKSVGLERDQVRVIVPEVGGGFGAKASVYPEDLLVARLALELGRPVRFVETRTENLTTTVHGRGQEQRIAVAADEDGRLLAVRAEYDVDFGAYVDNQRYAAGLAAMMASGCYRIPRLEARVRGILTNTPPTGAFRGAGRPEAAYLIERAIEQVAAAAGLDPVEVRRRNFIPPDEFPYDTGVGAVYDSGDYGIALDAAVAKAGYEELRAEQRRRRESGEGPHLGIGLSSYVELSSGGDERASVTVLDSGRVQVRTGTSPTGQGHRTTWAQIVADELGVPFDHIDVILGDTGEQDTGGGTGGSRSAPIAGSAVVGAAEAAAGTLRRLAAEHLEASADDIVLAGGEATVVGTDVGVTLADLAAAGGGAIREDFHFEAANLNYPFGTHLCAVEVDGYSGEVRIVRYVSADDCGRVINPMVVEGQIQGGALQGIAQALWEQVVFDESGTLLTANFASYGIPRLGDAPDQLSYRTETPSPNNPRGMKGVGESGATGGTPAVVNAVVDALAHLGVPDEALQPPLLPEKVWAALRGAAS